MDRPNLNSENTVVKQLTVQILESLQSITREDLEDVLKKANFSCTEGKEWELAAFKFVTVKFMSEETYAVYDIALSAPDKSWSKMDTISLPFDIESGKLK